MAKKGSKSSKGAKGGPGGMVKIVEPKKTSSKVTPAQKNRAKGAARTG